jgi:hypothetical protein
MKPYGIMELTQASPAQSFVEPLSVDQLMDYLRITADDLSSGSQTMMLEGLIAAARQIAEVRQGRDLITKQWDLTLDLLYGYDAIAGAAYPLQNNGVFNLGMGFEIPLRVPLQSVDLFQYTDYQGNITTLVEDTDYLVDTRRGYVVPPYGKLWPFFTPQPSSSVLIRFKSGYAAGHPWWGNDGQRIMVAMMMLCSLWYEDRMPISAGAMQELPYSISALLDMGSILGVH